MFLLLIRAAVWLLRAALRSRDDLVLENLALRQQLAIYNDKRPQPRLTDPARALGVGLIEGRIIHVWGPRRPGAKGARAPSSMAHRESEIMQRSSAIRCLGQGSSSVHTVHGEEGSVERGGVGRAAPP